MSSNPGVKVIYGAGHFGTPTHPTVASIQPFVDAFRSYGYVHIDSARQYPAENPGFADKSLKLTGATEWATVDTKVISTIPKAHSRENATKSMRESLEFLGFPLGGGEARKQVDVMFLHAPCPDVSFEEVMETMDEAYKKGWFRRFGLSNYSPEQVEELVQIAKDKGYVQPTVYQGQYNALARLGESSLFPILRKHGIAFHAYTPTAAGIFSGIVTKDSIHKPDGRWTHTSPLGKWFSSLYFRPEIFEAVRKVQTEAEKHGINGHDVALRWCLHHSILKGEYGDGIIIGASTLDQLHANLKACQAGPLPEDLAKVVDDVWKVVEPVAPYAYMDKPPPELLKMLEEMKN